MSKDNLEWKPNLFKDMYGDDSDFSDYVDEESDEFTPAKKVAKPKKKLAKRKARKPLPQKQQKKVRF